MTFLETLRSKLEHERALYLVLLDPDRLEPAENAKLAAMAADGGADVILVGGSLSLKGQMDETVRHVKASSDLPVVLFPGNLTFLSAAADALLYLSLVSGRNPELLIGEHVKAAPHIRGLGLEPIPTAYMLVDGGATTSVEFMSGTRPLPRNKPDIAMAHALAAEYMGMKLAFFDAGSGAELHVPPELIAAVTSYVSLPVMVGGGVRRPEEADALISAGARLLVTGDVIERTRDAVLLRELADAVHGAQKGR